jgi:LysR family hydrogen peroxide-inducible transcriptional activator
MVDAGSGVTVLPGLSVNESGINNKLVEYRPFSRPVPKRDVILAYRESYPGKKLIKLITDCMTQVSIPWSR